MGTVVTTTVDDTETIVKRADEPSGNVSRVYEPVGITASDEELQKNIQSKLQELSGLLASRGEGMGPVIEQLRDNYMKAANDLLAGIQTYSSPK